MFIKMHHAFTISLGN